MEQISHHYVSESMVELESKIELLKADRGFFFNQGKLPEICG